MAILLSALKNNFGNAIVMQEAENSDKFNGIV
jgi:hypothetical protein